MPAFNSGTPLTATPADADVLLARRASDGALVSIAWSTIVDVAGGSGSSGAVVAADISDFAEAVDDRVAAYLTAGTGITLTNDDAGNFLTIAASGGGGGSGTLPRGYIDGCQIEIDDGAGAGSSSPSSSAVAGETFTVHPGAARDSTDSYDLLLATAMSKIPGTAWSAGDGGGALVGSGTFTGGNWPVYLIRKDADGSVDAMILAWVEGTEDPLAPTLPTGYTAFRRIGFVVVEDDGLLALVHQDGDDFWYETPPASSSFAVGTTGQVEFPVGLPNASPAADPPYWPMLARLTCQGTGGAAVLVTDPGTQANSDLTSVVPNVVGGNEVNVLSSRGSIRLRSASAQTVNVTVRGWTDRRGKDF